MLAILILYDKPISINSINKITFTFASMQINDLIEEILLEKKAENLKVTMEHIDAQKFFTTNKDDQTYLLFELKTNDKANEEWFKEILHNKQEYHDTNKNIHLGYVGLYHDCCIPLYYMTTMPKHIGTRPVINVYLAKLNVNELLTLENDEDNFGFNVLPPHQGEKEVNQHIFCIGGGIARTKLYVDNTKDEEEQHTKNIMMTIPGHASKIYVHYCCATTTWVNTTFQENSKSAFNRKLICGTQICMSSEYIKKNTVHVATLSE